MNHDDMRSLQQETAFKIWDEIDQQHRLPFWEWYSFYCLENGLFNDRQSGQN